jgi:hypothetical protein
MFDVVSLDTQKLITKQNEAPIPHVGDEIIEKL